MIYERVKKMADTKRGCQVSYSCLRISNLYLTYSLLMHSYWSHCLQEFISPGTLAEKSHHLDLKNFVDQYEDASGKTWKETYEWEAVLLQKYEESLSSADKFKTKIGHEPICHFQNFHANSNPLQHFHQDPITNAFIF